MASYKYPQQKFEDDYDFLMVESIEYVPPGLGGGGRGQSFVLGTGNQSSRNGAAKNTIFLPMPINIADNNSANWEADRLNGIDAAIVRTANTTLNTLNAEDLLSDPLKAVTDAGLGIVNATKTAVGDILDNDKKAAKQFAIAKAVGTFRNVNANSVISRTTGKVLNPNVELLFKSPDLRAFEYQFDLTPRSSSESEVIKNIIRVLKRDSAPKKGNSAGLFLTSPNVFRLSFMRGGQKHPFLNSFKICALKGMRVDYTSGTGGYRVYEDSTPVKMSMSLSFTELTPVYAEDYNENSDGVGF